MTTQNTDALNALLADATRGPVEYNTAGLIKRQKLSVTRRCEIDGQRVQVTASLRFDDECGNKHETFSITGEVRYLYTLAGEEAAGRVESCGCVHEDIAAAFPELARFIPWHLVSTPGPMHYAANTLYHARDVDHNGLKAGQPRIYREGFRFPNGMFYASENNAFSMHLQQLINHGEPLGEAVALPDKEDSGEFGLIWAGGATFKGFDVISSHTPFKTYEEAAGFREAFNTCIRSVTFERIPLALSKGKPRDLEAARRCAIWPEATDDELCAPDLAEKLAARLPALQARFAADMAALGFTLPESMAALIPA